MGRAFRENTIAVATAAAVAVHLVLRYGLQVAGWRASWPLWIALAWGGVPLLIELGRRAWRREFGSDLLAGIAIVTSVIAGEYLVGAIIVLMLSGGATLERMATRRASRVLEALARRVPLTARRLRDGEIEETALSEVAIGDHLQVLPHEICPVDGTVLEGRGAMDESYLTGEPFIIPKTPGSTVLSGAINGEAALVIRADKLAVDSRYAKIMEVMSASEQRQPRLRRLGDMLGAWYTPLAVGLAILAWVLSGDPERFLAVIVIATPCPLILAIPVAVVGAISLAAKHAIIIKNPGALEQLETCRVVMLDKTGTLTFGRPVLTEMVMTPGFERERVLRRAASLERYSKHPLAEAVVAAARKERLTLPPVNAMSEPPGQGLTGEVEGEAVRLTGRGKLTPGQQRELPPPAPGLESVVLIAGEVAAVLRFRDEPRPDTRPFVAHLGTRHAMRRVVLVSGDRASEVNYLAEVAGITEVYAGQTPEQKLNLVHEAVARERTLFVGDGINDAPALMAATVGVAFGPGSDIAAEAADAVILTPSLRAVDQLLHISRRMRRVALQSAGFGMAASLAGMALAGTGYLPPLAGAIAQEVIDLSADLNAVRTALPGRQLTDY
jgi:heavy metal translocating P-type ATPase